MRPLFHAIFLLHLATAGALAQNATTAFSAVRILPKGENVRIARIEAREGNPTPERWHILVHDPKDENGLREYVVSGGEVVASRTLSQFAEALRPEDIISADRLQIDSDRAARLAQAYAQANNYIVAALNYQLRKDAAGGGASWTVTCVDPTGKRLGEVVVAADKGGVLSHGGFALEPMPEKPRTSQTQIVVTDLEARERAMEREREKVLEREREREDSRQRKVVNRTREPEPAARTEPEPEKANPLQKIGGSLQRFFGGRGR